MLFYQHRWMPSQKVPFEEVRSHWTSALLIVLTPRFSKMMSICLSCRFDFVLLKSALSKFVANFLSLGVIFQTIYIFQKNIATAAVLMRFNCSAKLTRMQIDGLNFTPHSFTCDIKYLLSYPCTKCLLLKSNHYSF